MHFLAHTVIFLILLPLYCASNCTSCGYGQCLNSTSNGNCINCACPSNFSGNCCEIEPADGCTPNPCPAASPNEYYQCVNYTGGRYQCVCADDIYGPNCSDCINSTTSATGVDIAGGFITSGSGNPLQCCQQCYSMPNCVAFTYYTQNKNYCWFWPRTTTKSNTPITTVFLYEPYLPSLANPTCSLNCLNGGMCVVAANGTSYCDCLDIWSGSDCSIFDPCAYFQSRQNYTCLNGGICFSNSTYFPWYTCICPTGFSGSRCENNSVAKQIAAGMGQSNFNQQYLPYILANMTLEEKMNASWQVADLYTWAAYEDTELDLNTDLIRWYEPEMGNCFTFNHQNATKIYKLRYSGERGGFRAKMTINQAEYLNWVYTASLLVFLHRREETIMGESVSYTIAPGEETTFVIQRNVYTRLGKPYGICIQSKTEVKSYYNPGSAYTIDSCIRSCYQDYVQQICGCMDPKYYMAYNATPCDLSAKNCVDNITLARGQPSTWSECYCPPPCNEYIIDVAWTKTVFRTFPTQCEKSENSTDLWYEECMANYTSSFAIFNVQFSRLYHKSFVEKPKYTFSSVLSSCYNITGLILGLAVISLFEFAYLAIRLFHVICMNEEAIHQTKMDRHSVELAKKNCFNVPTVCLENHPLQQ